ncbi:MAG: pentapeptide repeat-containing protein [Anaerolineae bacterium]|nr:pentapeptide repeat-containing protein [Anaerolineae bacterium]
MALDREDILARISQPEGPRADLSGEDLSGADLSRLDLRGVDLSRADLSAADLRWAVLEGADLHSSVLRKADVRWAIMRGANLRQADLGRANLGWADLAGADLSGAELDGASLDNVDLALAIIDRAPPAAARRPELVGATAMGDIGVLPMGRSAPVAWPRIGAPSLPGGLTLPQVSARTLVIAFTAILIALQVWGWRYRSSYFLDGFGLREQVDGLVSFGQPANLRSGLVDVLPILLRLALTLPLLIIGLLVVAGLIVLPIALLWRFGERMLTDVLRPRWRPVVVAGLFLTYTALFVLILIPSILKVGGWAIGRGLPGTGVLGLMTGLMSGGSFWLRGALVLALAGLLWPLALLARHMGTALAAWEPPVAWRLRYPVLNGAGTYLRASPFLARLRPLEAEERRRGLLVAGGLSLALATLIAGTGRVQAQSDMCDGGNLPRVLLYLGDREPHGGSICQRLLAETDDHVYTFFPSQTSVGETGAKTERRANVREIEKSKSLAMVTLPSAGALCATCATGSDGSEVAVVDPAELKAEGPIAAVAGRVITLDVAPGEGVFDSLVLSDITEILVDGVPAEADALVAGKRIVAYGNADPAAPTKLNARQISVVVARGPQDTQGGSVQVDLSNPWTPIFSGNGWQPGSQLQVRLVAQQQLDNENIDPTTVGHLLAEIPIPMGGSGSYSSPVRLTDASIPTGPAQRIVVVDPKTGAYTVSSQWLSEPLPPPTPVPTDPPLAPTLELPTPGGDATATLTVTPEAAADVTNTPLPTPKNAPGGGPGGAGAGAGDCGDEFEPDNYRGQEREVYPDLGGDGKAATHKSCYKGDIDLASFEVKGGRWYRISTKELAPGVDTLIAAGDLPEGSTCLSVHPDFGCWNDDKDGNVLDSEILFRAGGNGRVLVTVDNRGTRFGSEASYGLAVSQTTLEPSPTPSVGPSLTPSPTRTRLPKRDDYDNTAANNSCRYATILKWATPWEDPLEATLSSASDQDWYQVELRPFNTADGVGYYQVVMTPPDDHDYDMDVGNLAGAGQCNDATYKHRSGDGEEIVEFRADVTRTIWIEVYGRPGANEFDPYEFYELMVRYKDNKGPVSGGSTAQPSNVPNPTPKPTWTPPTPSATPTPPGRSLP